MTTGLKGQGLTKRFGGVLALDSVDLQVMPGRVTALLGANGAGKSTLVACLSGARQPDRGTITLNGQPLRLRSPEDARRAGIVVVHQEPQMLEQQSVAANIYLSRLAGRSVRGVAPRSLVPEAARHLASLGIHDLDAERPMHTVAGAHRQLVEIARALADDPTVLFLDEPNASLGEEETGRLFEVVRTLRARGVAIVLISHRLREVYRIADQVVVMRDGRKVAEGTVEDMPMEHAVDAIVGARGAPVPPAAGGDTARGTRHPATTASDTTVATADMAPRGPVLELQGLSGPGFQDVTMSVEAGEIVGVSGLVGSGRTEVAHAVIGATRPTAGRVVLHGRPVQHHDPSEAVRDGIVFVPEGRRDAVFYGQTIDFNIRSGTWGRMGRGRRRPGRTAGRRQVQELMRSLAVKASSSAVRASTLSGGNQQKLLFARALAARPTLLILDEPTHGVDVATKRETHRLIRQLAAEGMAVWFISSEAEEVGELATRIVVMREGRVIGERPGGTSVEAIVALGFGETHVRAD